MQNKDQMCVTTVTPFSHFNVCIPKQYTVYNKYVKLIYSNVNSVRGPCSLLDYQVNSSAQKKKQKKPKCINCPSINTVWKKGTGALTPAHEGAHFSLALDLTVLTILSGPLDSVFCFLNTCLDVWLFLPYPLLFTSWYCINLSYNITKCFHQYSVQR